MNPINKINVPDKISAEMRDVLHVQYENAKPIAADADNSTIRQTYIEERKYWNEEGPKMLKTLHEKIATSYGEISVRIYYPQRETAATIFYLHGGGFIVGNHDTHDRIMRLLADYTGCAVIGVDYTLSPEAHFPQAIEETVAVCRYFSQRAADYQLNMQSIGFAGDSAGAMLALATALWLRDREIDCGHVKGVLLYYGLYGLQDSASRRLYGGVWDGLTGPDIEFYQHAYLANEHDKESPYYCLFNNDLSHNIPACFIATAEFDPLIDDSIALHRTLSEHQQPCRYKMYPGTLHAFLHYSRMMESADRALRDGARYFCEQLEA